MSKLKVLVYCIKSPFILIVIPGLTRNPVFLKVLDVLARFAHSASLRSPRWSLPRTRYGAGMTASELM
jgi:hypothetical protein